MWRYVDTVVAAHLCRRCTPTLHPAPSAEHRVAYSRREKLFDMTITVTLPDGSTHEVQPDALTLPEGAQILEPDTVPSGYVPKEHMERVIRDRLSGKISISALKDAGVPFKLDDDGNPVATEQKSDIDLDAQRKKWEEEKVKPLQDRLDTISRRLIGTAVRDALRDHVDPRFLQAPAEQPSYAEQLFSQRVRFDPESGDVYAVGPDGNPVPTAQEGRTYADPSEHLPSLLKQEGYSFLRKPEADPQRGAGYKPGGGGSGAQKRSEMTRTEKAAYVKEHGRDAYDKLPQ